jgi:hypothetical protein
VVRLTSRAREELRSGEALVFDWHHVAICCAAAGEVSLGRAPVDRLERSRAYRRVATEPPAPVFIHRRALPHFAGRDVAVDCRRRLGLRRFVSDLPPDFGLRASLGRLAEEGSS